ncbi:MAG: hypothetical protein EZS28_022224 [Streblomastix strix]|uniref:Uncharacterized protein n=1 Tax=Streblomastix strix TaxID=222440 RepID=A0A5J4VIC4_9EUKA|nr:MAG: hypothetical protein EZS28_022223 [Streblomastix strix]KAA6382250.1 MAG: hypothetical protein EZS28_022224 [Streblomastix strix]
MKLETNGVMTLKNINLINNDFLAKITTLEQEVNVIQQTLGTATQDIGGLQQQIDVINEELNRQTHFRGYYLLNIDIQNLPNSANGDFAFSAESGTVWMYDAAWYNSGDIVPDQVTPASDANPLIDSGTGVVGTSTEYSRGDHQHPLQVSTSLPSKDTSVGIIGSASSYARSDHQHPIQTVDTIPNSDSADGSYGTVESYARNDHSHPINVQTNASIIPIVNGVGNNGTSAYYSRHDHVHPQQLTYDGNVTATKFIKSGGTVSELLCANGDTTTISTIDSDSVKKTGKSLQVVQGYLRYADYSYNDDEASEESDDDDYQTRRQIYSQYVNKSQTETITGRKTFKNDQLQFQGTNIQPLILFNNNNGYCEQMTQGNEVVLSTTQSATSPLLYINYRNTNLTSQFLNAKVPQQYVLHAGTPTSYASVTSGNVQINPSATAGFDDGLRIARTIENTGSSSIELGCSRTSNSGSINGQWSIFTPPSSSITNPQSFVIAVSSQAGDNTRGLQISADGNTLTFNGRVI